MKPQFYSLSVKEVIKQTDEAVSVTFDVPEDLKEVFSYKQGQYLTLKFMIKGKEVRRAYSMCSSPAWDEPIRITVKKVPKGLVSTYINEELKPGQEVEVMSPEGRFYTELNEDHRKSYFLFGSGSGITPMMSTLKTILEKEPKSSVFLLYGNRNEISILLKDELEDLQKRYENQFLVNYILSQPKKEKKGGLSGFLKKAVVPWEGKIGRIDEEAALKFLEENPSPTKEAEYFICGPGNMNEAVQHALSNKGIEKDHIHIEHYSSNKLPHEKMEKGDNKNARLTGHLDGENFDVEVPGGETILDTLITEGYDPPYSCTSGSCATCMAKVLKGTVEMEVCLALDEDEIEAGYVLTCQSRPTSEEVEITYDI